MPSRKNIDANNLKIINLATPTNDFDAATKKYVDDNIGSGSQFLPYSTSWLDLEPNGNLDILIDTVSTSNRQLCFWGYLFLVGNDSSDPSSSRTHAIYHVVGNFYVYIDDPFTVYSNVNYILSGGGYYLNASYYVDSGNCYLRIANSYSNMIYKVKFDYNKMLTNLIL
ncbi:MAG: hypothetical protein ABIM30_00500 [candidate division WOR-3 bacterium]